jgi:hypothetical protein
MFIQAGQLNDVRRQFPSTKKEDCTVLMEFGNDRGTSFNGDFIVRIKQKGVYRFERGKFIKRVY